MKRLLLILAFVAAWGFMLACDDVQAPDSEIYSAIETTDDTINSDSKTSGTQSGSTASDESSTVTQMTAAEQKEFLKTYVSLGDSLTHGCQGINVEENRQYYSYPAQLARAMNTEFNQPLVEFPGIGMPNPEDSFKNGWYDTWSITISKLIKTMLYWYRVERYDDQATLNNFGISGATLDDIISYDGTKKISDITDSLLINLVGLMNPFICSVVGLNPAKVKSALEQALDRDPSFVSVWIGNNDTIFATIMGDDGSLLMTEVDKWKANWDILVAKIKAKKSVKGVLLINLPDNTQIPYLQPLDNGYTEITEGADIPEGSKVPVFSTRVSCAADVITPEQIATVQDRIIAINEIINETAEKEGWALVDAYTMIRTELHSGVYLTKADGTKSNIKVNGDYATGGFMSLDGIHPCSTGYAIIANRCAKAINETYGTSIPVIDEVAVWQKDTLCQDPIDPRDFPDQMGNLTYIVNTMVRLMAQFM
ncbi:MAG TPA: SGNH/GDSL hydrolase family protein [Spirochaetota bacterium]|nr:SGNH/GDSL hydrolase family protein [Spirochaetota bacterium]